MRAGLRAMPNSLRLTSPKALRLLKAGGAPDTDQIPVPVCRRTVELMEEIYDSFELDSIFAPAPDQPRPMRHTT